MNKYVLPICRLLALLCIMPAVRADVIQRVNAFSVVSWENDVASDRKFHADGLRWDVHPLSLREGAEPAFVLTVRLSGVPPYRQTIRAKNPIVQFAAGKFDPALSDPQLIVSTHTGGEYCCAIRLVILHRPDGWSTVTLPGGAFDENLDYPQDVNGDGIPDFVLSDDRFAYVFDDYVDSRLPPRIFSLRNGELEDKSGSRRFDEIFQNDLITAKAGCARHIYGACAGYVADAARLGQLDAGWHFMLANYCQSTLGCSENIDFPQKLARFLAKIGYITDAQADSLPVSGLVLFQP